VTWAAAPGPSCTGPRTSACRRAAGRSRWRTARRRRCRTTRRSPWSSAT
jgi:hypothetical protein